MSFSSCVSVRRIQNILTFLQSAAPTVERPIAPLHIGYSIFTPFTGFGPSSSSVVSRSREEQLKYTAKNVEEQQAAVRNNIATIYELRAEHLIETAKQETAAMVGHYGLCGDDPLEHKKLQRAKDKLFERCMAGAEVYEAMLAASGEIAGEAVGPLLGSADGNAEMGSTGAVQNSTNNKGVLEKTTKPTTVRGINQKLSLDLKTLVDQGVTELESYDKHAEGVLGHYQCKLKDEQVNQSFFNISKIAPPQISPSRMPPPRIASLPGGRKESALDFVRRLSTGMPIVGASVVPKKKVFESMEDLRR